MRHALGKKGLHGRLALVFEGLHARCRGEEVHGHVSATAERWLEFFQHEKNFAVIVARLMFWQNAPGPTVPAILTSIKVRTGAIVRVIKTKACRSWSEYDPALAVGGNEGSAFFRCAIYVSGNHLAMPMQLFRDVRFI